MSGRSQHDLHDRIYELARLVGTLVMRLPRYELQTIRLEHSSFLFWNCSYLDIRISPLPPDT
jgi:hypothetical protein